MGQRVVAVAADRFPAWRERFDANNPDGPQRVVGVSRLEPRWLAVVLIRRGGYAVALIDGSTLVAHKVGTRHVQSRTAAVSGSENGAGPRYVSLPLLGDEPASS